MIYPIDKGVEMPARREVSRTYPFLDMVPGDSFLIECAPEERSRVYKNLLNSCSRFCRKHKCKFTGRIVDVGVRCWRVK